MFTIIKGSLYFFEQIGEEPYKMVKSRPKWVSVIQYLKNLVAPQVITSKPYK